MSYGNHFQLWIGNLEPYMTEEFILSAFRQFEEHAIKARLIRNKTTGELTGYGFIGFATNSEAMKAMHKLNGKPIPGTLPIVRFKLNFASNCNNVASTQSYSIWIGDLSVDVDDYQLYSTFSNKYVSILTAKVILDSSGFSKGYGFVRFAQEEEQRKAFEEMNGFRGLGTKRIRVGPVTTKYQKEAAESYLSNTTEHTSTAANDYCQYSWSANYWQDWHNYYNYNYSNYNQSQHVAEIAQHSSASTVPQASNYNADMSQYSASYALQWESNNQTVGQQYNQSVDEAVGNNSDVVAMENDYDLVDYRQKIDTNSYNENAVNSDIQFYDALENSKWSTDEYTENIQMEY